MASSPANDKAHHSRFVEGDAVTGEEVVQRSRADSNGHFYNILLEEDAHAQRRRRSSSRSTSSSSSSSIPKQRKMSSRTNSSSNAREELGRKMGLGSLRRSLDSSRPEIKDEGKLSVKIRGRLRAWTHGHDRDVRTNPYPGT